MAYDTLSTRFQHFYDPETYSLPFNNLNDDQSEYIWQGSNEEGIITSTIEWPLEENASNAEGDDPSDIDLHNVLVQILKESSYQTEISSFFQNYLKPDQQKTPMPLKTKEGYIDLFDLLIFGSLRSRKVHADILNEEESNEEGIFHTVASDDAELTVTEEESFEDEEDEEDDEAFIELLLSNKHLDGEFIMETILNMMKKHSNDVDDDDEEEEVIDDQYNDDLSVVEPLAVSETVIAVVEPEERKGDTKFLGQMDKKEGTDMDHVFASVFDF